jgi:hypothetical protein
MAAVTDPRERLRRTMPGDVLFNGSERREVVEVECAVDYVERHMDRRIWATDGTRSREANGYTANSIEAHALIHSFSWKK